MVEVEVAVAERSCEVSGDFACNRCGQRDEFSISLDMKGHAPVGATSQEALEAATERARRIATRASQQTIHLLRCPRCQELNPGSLGRFIRGQAVRATAFGLISSVGPIMYALRKGEDPTLWGTSAFVLGMLVSMVLGYRRARSRRVRFASSATRSYRSS